MHTHLLARSSSLELGAYSGGAGVGVGFDRRPSGYVTEKEWAGMLPFIRYRLECLLLCGLNWQRTAWPCDSSENTMRDWNRTENFICLCWELANVSVMNNKMFLTSLHLYLLTTSTDWLIDMIWIEMWSITIKHHPYRELTVPLC